MNKEQEWRGTRVQPSNSDVGIVRATLPAATATAAAAAAAAWCVTETAFCEQISQIGERPIIVVL